MDYEKAVSLGKKLLGGKNYDCMNTEISRLTGESYFRTSDDDNAQKYMEQYLSEAGENPMMSAKYIMGVLCYRNSDYDKAIDLLSEVSEEDNVLGQSAYYHLGQVYRRKGNMTMASIAFEKAASMTYSRDTQESAFYNYATAQVNGARTPSGNAIEMLEGFLNRYPNSRYASDVSSYLVALYVNGSDYSKALASINRIKSPAKNVLEAKQIVLYNLGVNALSGDKVAEAEKYLLQARELAKYNRNLDAQVSLWLGECAYRKGDYDVAAKYQNEYLKAVKSTDVNYGIGYYNLGYTRFQQQKYSDARSAFNKAISSKKLSENNENDANNRIGDTYYYKGQFKTAQKYYEKSAGDYALYQKAMMLGYSKDYSGKVEQLKSLIAKYSSSSLVPVALLEEGDAYVNLNENKKAVNAYNELISNYPNSPYSRKAMLNMAIAERNSKNEASAIAAYQDVIRKYPSSEEASVALEDLKLIYAERGELNKLRDFVATIENAPELDVNEMDRLAFEAAEKSYIENNDNIDKMKDYLLAYPNGTFSANAKYYIAKYHFGKGENDEALALITEVENNVSGVTFAEDLMAMKASILVAQSKHDKAIEAFKALETNASNSDNRLIAQLGVMRSATKIDSYAVMAEYADKLLNGSGLSATEEKEAKFCRAYARYKQGDNNVASKEFVEMAKNSSSIYGAQSAYYLAELQFGENRLSDAENTLNSFIDLGTEHDYWLARAFILLADVYNKQGKTFEAREYLESLKGSYPGEGDGIKEMIDSRLKKWSSNKTKKK